MLLSPPSFSAPNAPTFSGIISHRSHFTRAENRHQDWLRDGHFAGPDPTDPTEAEEKALISSGCYKDFMGHWRPPPCRDAPCPPQSDLLGRTNYPFSRQGDRAICAQGVLLAARSLWLRADDIFEDALYGTAARLIVRWLARSMQAASSGSPSSCEHPAGPTVILDAPTSPLVLCTSSHHMQCTPVPEIDFNPAARVSRAPIFMDQDQALLLAAFFDARLLLKALRHTALLWQLAQFQLCMTDWKLNRMLQDTEILLAIAALTLSMDSARTLARTISDAQTSHEAPLAQGPMLTDILTIDISGKSNLQPSSPSTCPSSLYSSLLSVASVSSSSTDITSDTNVDSLTDLFFATDQLQPCEALSTISHRNQYWHCGGDAEPFTLQGSSSSSTNITSDTSLDSLTDFFCAADQLQSCEALSTISHHSQYWYCGGDAEPFAYESSSSSSSSSLTEDLTDCLSSPSRPSSPSTSPLLKAAGRNAASLDRPTPKERYLTRDPTDISTPAFWALNSGIRAALHQAAHIQGTSSSSIISLPECCTEWLFGSPDDYYCISAHRKQQHRQRLQDYKKLKQLEFSLLYLPRRKLRTHLGFKAWGPTPQDAETDANIQDFIAKAIRRAERLINYHESRKALCASVRPIGAHSEQSFEFRGHHYQFPIIRHPLDQADTQFAVFDPLD
jgi:hypothetical protein